MTATLQKPRCGCFCHAKLRARAFVWVRWGKGATRLPVGHRFPCCGYTVLAVLLLPIVPMVVTARRVRDPDSILCCMRSCAVEHVQEAALRLVALRSRRSDGPRPNAGASAGVDRHGSESHRDKEEHDDGPRRRKSSNADEEEEDEDDDAKPAERATGADGDARKRSDRAGSGDDDDDDDAAAPTAAPATEAAASDDDDE